ncbi:INO80 complex subunit E isoform X4 [Leopardus geoffroyi]|uniref:INO80 complex subunit E isoform X4 n=1 Tax=Leopardus geoffroyi TaxID=46844 RepID=UPI001E264D0D|nr:INO80 complex subunit E isoform X4 [Leopardus geoffroyi]
MNGPADGEVDYKKKYRNLKRKLKFLIYEHECFQEELRKAQRKLLKVSRDKSFLLDRLLQYENVDEDSSDSDATASSDNSETEGTPKLSDTPAPKSPLPCPFSRKRSPPLGGVPSPSSLSLPPSTGFPLQASGAPSPYLSSLPEPSPLRPKREKRPRLPRKLKAEQEWKEDERHGENIVWADAGVRREKDVGRKDRVRWGRRRPGYPEPGCPVKGWGSLNFLVTSSEETRDRHKDRNRSVRSLGLSQTEWV